MKNIKLILAYDGTRYSGWQRQGNTKNTIQEKLEYVLTELTGEPIEVSGSGRTDAGVHAYGQVANFHISDNAWKQLWDTYGTESNMRKAVNIQLPDDIKVLEWKEAGERFHSRLNATKKQYTYTIDCGAVPKIFNRKYVMRLEEALDVKKMKHGAQLFLGEHNFQHFCSNKRMKKSTVRTIYEISIREEDGLVVIDYIGNGFLYNMVRLMTGTLIEIGQGKMQPEDIQELLKESKDVDRKTGFLAPAKGLVLNRVWYD